MDVTITLDACLPPRSSCIALGFFNGLHTGHMAVIQKMIEQSDKKMKTPCVFTFSIEGGAPVAKTGGMLLSMNMSQDILRNAGVRTLIRPPFSEFRDLTPESFVFDVLHQRLGAAGIVCGENFRFGRGASGNAETLARLCDGIIELTVVSIKQQDGLVVSSSAIRQLIREGAVHEAAQLLGRPFVIDFKVVRGRQLGRTLDFPTINQPFPNSFIKPKFGVYATATLVGGVRYPSVTNVGVKPTVGSDNVLAETYIHNFSDELYGQNIQVEFLRFIREERRFNSIDELKAQIMQDNKEASEIL